MRGKFKKISSLIFSSIFIFFSPVYADSDIKKIEQSRIELKNKKAELSKKLREASEKVRENAKETKSTQEKIESCQQEIDACNKYIIFYDNEILKMESQIKTINKDIEQKKLKLKKCLKSIYIAGDTSTIDIILGAKDFNDFLEDRKSTRLNSSHRL